MRMKILVMYVALLVSESFTEIWQRHKTFQRNILTQYVVTKTTTTLRKVLIGFVGQLNCVSNDVNRMKGSNTKWNEMIII